jgi:hypothetical protein
VPTSQEQRILDLVRAGHDPSDTGRWLQVNQSTVVAALRDLSIDSVTLEQRIFDLVLGGHDAHDVAAWLDVTFGTVMTALQDLAGSGTAVNDPPSAGGSGSQVTVNSGSGSQVTVNSGPVGDGLVPLAVASQPTAQPSGIAQPLPPMFGFQFPGTNLYFGAPTGSQLCAGRDGNIWVASQSSGSITPISPAGVAGSAIVGPNLTGVGGQSYGAVCSGPDGNLWFGGADATATQGLVVTAEPSGTILQALIVGTPPSFAFNNFCSGADGYVYAGGATAALDRGQIWKLGVGAALGTSTLIWDSTELIPTVTGLAAGPDGNVWSGVEQAAGSSAAVGVLVIKPNGDHSQINVNEIAVGLCAGPDGNVWLAGASGQVWRITPAGVAAVAANTGLNFPRGICAGAGGDLWVSGESLVKVTVEGHITAFALTGGSTQAEWICVGPDGAFWMTDESSGVFVAPFLLQFGGAVMTALPTADPHNVGQLWNNAGALTVSAG